MSKGITPNEEEPLLSQPQLHQSPSNDNSPPSYTGEDEERGISMMHDYEHVGDARNSFYKKISLTLYSVVFVLLILLTVALVLLFQQKDVVVNEIIQVQLDQLSIVNSEVAEFLGSVAIDYTQASNPVFRNLLMFSAVLVGKLIVIPERDLELSIMNNDKTYHFLDILPLESIVLEVNRLNELEIKMTYKIVNMENLIRLTDMFLLNGSFTLQLTDWLSIPHLQVNQVIHVKFEWDTLNQYLPQVSNLTIMEKSDRIMAKVDIEDGDKKFHLNTTLDFDLMFPCKNKLVTLGEDWKINRHQILGEISRIDNKLIECSFLNSMLQRLLLNDLIPFNIGFHNAFIEIKIPSSYLLSAYSALPKLDGLDIGIEDLTVKATDNELPYIECDVSFNDTFFQINQFQSAIASINEVVTVSAKAFSNEGPIGEKKKKKHNKRRLQFHLDIKFEEIIEDNFVNLVRNMVKGITNELVFNSIEIYEMEFESTILETNLDFNLTDITIPFEFELVSHLLNHSSNGLSFSIAKVEYVASTEDMLEVNVIAEIFSLKLDITLLGQDIELNISTGEKEQLPIGTAAFRDLFVNKRVNDTTINSRRLPTVMALKLYKSEWLGDILGDFVSNKPYQLNPFEVTNPEKGYINGVLNELKQFLPNISLSEFAKPLIDKTTIYLFNQEIEIFFHNPCDIALLLNIKSGKAYLTRDVDDDNTLVGEFKEQVMLIIPPGDSKSHKIPIRINPVSAQELRRYLNSKNGLQIWSKAELFVFVEDFSIGLNYTGTNVVAEVKL
ncbi:uncharacterized protein KQ657_001836 [Scheffersomyces spartinae]|uniref:Tag1-like fifth Ig-like domain-containing protein n=1 Tax=Scheffersomyces spartinae TaxID=45513 RepID=A0A9P7V742_9ASCO|nr:uncharacterized protein KQ657_001836 [Scheffersomyces spartinae]KAG7192435.1 hypothetical protein KQ657_001836 [Scheffersomyces spartinae]